MTAPPRVESVMSRSRVVRLLGWRGLVWFGEIEAGGINRAFGCRRRTRWAMLLPLAGGPVVPLAFLAPADWRKSYLEFFKAP